MPAPHGPPRPTGLDVVAVSGSPTRPSRSRELAEAAIELAGGGELIDLADLDPAALLGMGRHDAVDAARDRVGRADVLVVATPVYRATYTALTKTIFDLLPQGGLEGTVAVLVASGYSPDHRLSIDHGLRPLVASLGGWSVPTGVYATAADGSVGTALSPATRSALSKAVAEATLLARARRVG